jgi:hypothetical protein
MQANRRVLVVVLGVLGLGGLAAWAWWPRPRPALVMVGDSVTFLSIPAIEAELGDERDLDIRAYPGQRSNDLVLVMVQELVEREEADEPLPEMALLVGYNDVLRYRGEPGEVEELVALASRSACAVVLAVPAPPVWSEQEDIDGLRAAFAAFDTRLADEVDRYDNVFLWTGWRDAVEVSGPGELVDADGVHPIEAGQQRLASEYAAALDAHCGRR